MRFVFFVLAALAVGNAAQAATAPGRDQSVKQRSHKVYPRQQPAPEPKKNGAM